MQPIVSICITTYNHEKFIERTLSSVLDQKCSFPFEIIIFNDASTDRTDEIIRKIINDIPNITYKVQKKNVGISKNFRDSISSPKGKFVAILDGDDFWLDDYKLQRQVDFLESNPEFAAVFTDSAMFWGELLDKVGALKEKHKRNISINNLTDGGVWIPTSTFMYRRDVLNYPLPKIYEDIRMVDIFLFMLVLEKGMIGYLDIVSAAYRKHDAGIWSHLKTVGQYDFRIANYRLMERHFEKSPVLRSYFQLGWKSNRNKKYKFIAKSFLNKIIKSLKS